MEKLYEIAQQITDARKHEIPQQLVKLRTLINQNYDENFKHEIYKLNLLDALSTSFKYDYGYLRDGWDLAYELVKIFRDCVHNFFLTEKEYQNNLLPNSLENILVLSKKIQEKYKTGLDDFFRLFKSIHLEYRKIVSNHSYLAHKSFNSQRLFQLLLNDDQKTTTVVIETYNALLNAKKNVLRSLSESVLYSFLDEIIYKLASNEQIESGNAIFQLLTSMCKIDSYLIKLIARRYKGVKFFINKWSYRNLGTDFIEFKEFFDDAEKNKLTDDYLYQQAAIIQKTWRGYKCRKELKDKADKTKILQRAYRSHLEKIEKAKTKKMADDELRFQLMLRHRRIQRQRNIKLANLIEILPANKIDIFMERLRENSVKIIQATWRGYQTRKKFSQTRQILIQTKAAKKIQAAIRKWLERIYEKRQRPALYSRPKGLDNLKKEQLIDKIRKHIDNLPPHPRSEAQAQILHDKAQRMFQDYVLRQQSIRKQQYNIELLMVTSKSDAELITNAPRLTDINEQEIDNFFAHKSKPIQLEAKHRHKRMCWKSKAKWFELLDEESESDDELDENIIYEKFDQINPFDPFHMNNSYENRSSKGILKKERLKLRTNNINHLTNNFAYLQKILDS